MAEQEKKQTLSHKRKSHRATPCDNCGHPLASHHCLGTCKNKNCRCARFVSELKRRGRVWYSRTSALFPRSSDTLARA
jgi:hypothetical protein